MTTSAPPRLPVLAALSALSAAIMFSGCASLKQRFAKPPPPPPPTFTPTLATFTPTTVTDLPPIDPALLQRPTQEFRLGPGDQIAIEVLGDIATRSRTTVGPDGKIYFYVLPGIDVWGLTLTQARERISQELQKFVREQQPISISLRGIESQRIWLLGRLNRPGVYPMAGPMTLLEAIAEAGGPSPATAAASFGGGTMGTNARGASDEAADLGRAFVIRQGKMLRVDFKRLLRQGDMAQNIYLQPDDLVYLPAGTTGSIHVLGAVGQPKSMDYLGRMTLTQSLAQAGGSVRNAHLTNVAIVRGSLTEPKVAVIDFEAIQRGTAPDVMLEPQDIVYVPYTPYRVLTRYVDLILDTFARTVGVNEGARAISDRAVGVGVNVPIGGL
ncbi:MAG: SLBB domain-containing protein [Opitutaceae bacterium]